MIDSIALREILVNLESDSVERTQSVTDTKKFSEAICAFSNDMAGKNQPSYLLIGVDDSGKLTGLKVTDKLLLQLSDIRTDGNILPQPIMNVEKFVFSEGELAVVEVFPSFMPPARYKGRVCIRVGPRKAVASPQEEQVLIEKRISFAKTFDAQPAREAIIQDLSISLFDTYRLQAVDNETIEANHRSKTLQMTALSFYDNKNNCPTNAGLLLFGTNIRYYLSGAYIQFLQINGESLTDDISEQAEISGDLYSVIKQTELLTKSLVKSRLEKITTFQEKEIFDYPEWALREIIMNAIMHKNYESNTPIKIYAFSNRIEISNPGGLYGEASESNFPSQNSYRNPVIAGAMKILGFVNRFGHGVTRAEKLLEENKNPRLKFAFYESTFVATMYKRVK